MFLICIQFKESKKLVSSEDPIYKDIKEVFNKITRANYDLSPLFAERDWKITVYENGMPESINFPVSMF